MRRFSWFVIRALLSVAPNGVPRLPVRWTVLRRVFTVWQPRRLPEIHFTKRIAYANYYILLIRSFRGSVLSNRFENKIYGRQSELCLFVRIAEDPECNWCFPLFKGRLTNDFKQLLYLDRAPETNITFVLKICVRIKRMNCQFYNTCVLLAMT